MGIKIRGIPGNKKLNVMDYRYLMAFLTLIYFKSKGLARLKVTILHL
jgi:hypothetical protein